MTNRKTTFTVGEWYHCFNRSLDKRVAFVDLRDYYRFLELLYLANDDIPLRRGDLGTQTLEEVLRLPRGKKLVSIGAFCLMPTHFHLALKEVVEGGISTFMRKVGTAYPMYFNARYAREGNLFLKPFQSIHVPSERDLSQLISYIHSNAGVLYEPQWRTGTVIDPQFLDEHLVAYPHASLGLYRGQATPLRAIIDQDTLAGGRTLSLQKMLREARDYASDRNIP